MLQTVKSFKNIEFASICNLSCPYCPCKDQGEHRPVGFMNEPVFDRVLYWLKKFVENDTQREVNLFGIGESTLHPYLIDWTRRIRKILPKRMNLLINTNGVAFSEMLCQGLLDAGVDKIDLTDHDAYHSMKTVEIFRKLGMTHIKNYGEDAKYPPKAFGISRDAVYNPNNWGGLVDWVPEVCYSHAYVCPWLLRGQTMVFSDGRVTTCCQDAFARGVVGSVFDDNLDRIEYGPFVQCATCHERIPDGMLRKKVMEG